MGQAPVYPEDGDRGVAGGVDQGDEGGDDVPTYGGGGDGGEGKEPEPVPADWWCAVDMAAGSLTSISSRSCTSPVFCSYL